MLAGLVERVTRHSGENGLDRAAVATPLSTVAWVASWLGYPRISAAVAVLRTASATIDGEAVWCDGEGLAIFDKLHSRVYDGEVSLYAFDLLELDGADWRPRKGRLAKLLANAPRGIQYSEHLEGNGAAIFAHACKLGCEGIISKHREHPYRSGSSKAWLKTKT